MVWHPITVAMSAHVDALTVGQDGIASKQLFVEGIPLLELFLSITDHCRSEQKQ